MKLLLAIVLVYLAGCSTIGKHCNYLMHKNDEMKEICLEDEGFQYE